MQQISSRGEIKEKTKADAFFDSLKEGDKVEAEVLSSEKDIVLMKTDTGKTVRARLDGDAALLPGDKIQLEVTGENKGAVSLSIVRVVETAGEKTGQPGSATEIADKNLTPYINKLIELNLPSREEIAQKMRELIVEYPEMKLEEAAFLVANRLTGDSNLMKSALALIAGGEKTDEFLARLLALLNIPDSSLPVGLGSETRNPGPVTVGEQGQIAGNPESTVPSLVEKPTTVNESLLSNAALRISHSQPGSAPLTDWITQAGGTIEGEKGGFVRVFSEHLPDMKPIITQSDIILQSTNVENVEKNDEILQNSVQASVQPSQVQQKTTNPNHEFPATVGDDESVGRIDSHGKGESLESTGGLTRTVAESQNPLPDVFTSRQFMNQPSAGKAIAQILSDIPELHGTPASAIERFSAMLLRVAGESAGVTSGDAGKLEELLDKLFTRIGKNDNDGGQRLQTAKEELFARLALIDEAISRAAPPARAQMLEQTHRLMDHVRVQNNIDQFVYMQLPVQFGEERKTAELYMFRKKGGKRSNPENVNILLALDLENMGHWEALVNFRNKDVSIQMEVPGEAEKNYFGENTVMLHEMLAEAGFKLINTDIKYSAEKTTPITAMSSFEKYKSNRKGAIDFFI